MKLNFILYSIAFLPALAHAQQVNYNINGKLGEYNSPAKVYLEYYEQANAVVLDSAVVNAGEFHLQGKIDHPRYAFLFLNPKGNGIGKANDYKRLFLERGTITVSGKDKVAYAFAVGTGTNRDLELYNSASKEFTLRDDSLTALMKSASAEQKSDVRFMKRFDDADRSNTILRATVCKEFIEKHPRSRVSLLALENYSYSADYQEIKVLYDVLSLEVRTSDEGEEFASTLSKMETVAIGAQAPEFTEPDTSGRMINLSSFKGKYVLIDFWASWCPPCRMENPGTVNIYNEYKDKNFTIIGVSLDRPDAKGKWLEAIHLDKLSWTQVSELKFWKSEIVKQYAITAIPQNYLVDPDGKIIAKGLHRDDLEKKLAEVLGSESGKK